MDLGFLRQVVARFCSKRKHFLRFYVQNLRQKVEIPWHVYLLQNLCILQHFNAVLLYTNCYYSFCMLCSILNNIKCQCLLDFNVYFAC